MTTAAAVEIARTAAGRMNECESYAELLGLAACAVADAAAANARAKGAATVNTSALLDAAINAVLEAWSTDPTCRHLWEGFCRETGLDVAGPAEYDVTERGSNRDDCDACLYDTHYCPVCRDAVGHGHSHE